MGAAFAVSAKIIKTESFMNIKLYRQKIKERDGFTIYQGEDSHPYADKDIVIVADGLGGRGGFPHTKMNRDILEEDKLYDILFEPEFEAEVSDEFRSFVTNNFEELFKTKDYYDNDLVNDETVRRSGYFASRIVVAIALYTLKYNPKFSKERIFSEFDTLTDEQKETRAKYFADKLAEIVMEKLKRIAERAGFEMEVGNKGAYLLPSTLTVAVMNERDDGVDVLYLWAGDSRGYFWTETEGMAQVTEDHEEGETMTNLITLSRECKIEGRFLTLPKPCAVFCASDGVYKPEAFACPIDQEYLMLLAIDMFDNPEAAMKLLVDQYNMLSVDDSSTLALYGCGYETYADFRAAVGRRMAIIKEKYVGELPGLFDVDYQGDLNKLHAKAVRRFADEDVARKLLASPGVLNLVINDMEKRRYAPYLEIKNGDASSDADCAACKNEAWAHLVQYVENNWLLGEGIRKYIPAIKNQHPEKYGKKGGYKLAYELPTPLTSLYKSNVQSNFALLDGEYRSDTNLDLLAGLTREEQLDTVNERIVALKKQVLAIVDKEIEAYLSFRDEQQKLNREYLAFDKDAVDDLLERLGRLERVESLTWVPSAVEPFPKKLKEAHEQYIKVCEGMPEATVKDDGGAILEVAVKYWCGNRNLHAFVWNQYRELVSDSIIEDILGADPKDAAELKRLTEALATRKRVYGEYNREYNRKYRPSRL